MKDDAHNSPTAIRAMQEDEVRKLAQRAISILASHGPGKGDGLSHRLTQLCDAFIAADEDLRHDAMTRLRQDTVSTDDIIDHVIPATARMMGERWFADEISFVHVTIGTARLQEAVRALAAGDAKRTPVPQAPTILIVVPRCEHHTLGSFVAADQFRRMGYAVEIAVDRHPREIAQLLHKRRFAMVGITASGRRTLASARELVDIIRATAPRFIPVVVSGPVLSADIDVRAVTGADYTARDALTALRKCGLEVLRENTISAEVRTTDHAD